MYVGSNVGLQNLTGLQNMLCVAWPEPVKEVSDRDRNHALLSVDFAGLDL